MRLGSKAGESASVTAALIARNEASVIGACLDSLAGHVDEIVVVDTGSTDATPDIVASRGGRVLHFPWADDFSLARNHALEAATSDWILYIDADERLAVPEGRSLHDDIAAPDLAGVLIRLQPKVGYTDYAELRLFRRDPRIRFVGVIHERIQPSVLAVCAKDGKRLGNSAVRLSHVGYEGDQTRKHDRNLPLLRRYLAADPERIFCWLHLGNILIARGEYAEAEAALRRGLAVVARRRHPHDRYEASLCYQALARLTAKRGLPADDIVAEGLANHAGDHVLRLIKAQILIDRGDRAGALEILADLTAHDPDAFFDPALAFDRRIFGEFAYDLMGLAHFREERFKEAAAAWSAAAARASDGTPYRSKAAVAAGRAAQVLP